MVKKIFVIMLLAFMSMGCEAEPVGSTTNTKISAGGYTFTDERCKTARQSGVVCAAKSQPIPVSDLIGNKVDFETFIKLNREVLPEDVSKDTMLPAKTFYLIRVR